MDRKSTDEQLFDEKNKMLSERLQQVSAYEFYRDVFPEGWMEERGNYEDRKPNAIFTVVKDGSGENKYAQNTIMFDDLKELDEAMGAEFAVTSPITYSGKNRKAVNAYHLWGFAIDLDGVGMNELRDLLYQIENGVLPEPCYVVNSGNGLHIYYLFEEPIPLYQRLHKPLGQLKHGLTNRVWNKYTSNIDTAKKQFQGIFQGFRMVGSQSKLGKRYPVTAFKMGPKRTLQYLNDFVEERYRFDIKNYDEFNHVTIDEARERWSEWYQNRIILGQKRGRWTCKRDLYDWWIKQIESGAFEGNRYNCIVTLMTMAVKCGIDRAEALNDAFELLPWLNSLTETAGKNEFTEKDIYDAAKFYDENYVTYSIRTIEARTRIQIPRNKRNGRKQAVHLAGARAVQEINDKFNNTNWREGNGRPSAESKVKEWREKNPAGKKVDCIRETGLSKKTVYKWW